MQKLVERNRADNAQFQAEITRIQEMVALTIEDLLGTRVALQRMTERAEAAEAKLAERDAEIERLLQTGVTQ